MNPNDPSYQKPVYSEANLFYVIKSLSKNKYAIQWDDGSYKFGSFEKAIKWSNYYDAMDDLDGYENIGDLIVVGPCEEGEEP